MSPQEEPSTEPSLEPSTPKPPATTEVEVVPDWEVFFDAFWDFYPRKVGKPAARRAMKAKYEHDHRHAIADGIKAWVYHWTREHTEEQFIPHPATFLNQERFNDPTPTPTSTKLGKAEQAIEDWRLKQEAKEHIQTLQNRDDL